MRCPDQAYAGQRISSPFNVVDIMPTLLGLASAPIPDTVEGRDHTPAICGEPFEGNEAAYIMSIAPFAEYRGQPWRGVRTEQHTFVRNLDGPWLLYDNRTDPFPMNNLTGISEYAGLQQSMDDLLRRMMKERGDELLPAQAFLDRYGYEVDEEWGAVPYNP
jgi:arylsulfatase A-like enzyme